MKDAYYFSHDSNAKDDPKCMILIDQLGLEGYGIFWILIEILRDQPGYKYPLSMVPILARRYNTTAEKMQTVIEKYDLFHIDYDLNFFSFSLIERMKVLEEKRLKRSLAGIKGNELRWNKNQTDRNEIANGSQTDRKKSLSKVKESKVKESKEYTFDFGNLNSEIWSKWINYKKTQFKFTYKSPESEQVGIKQLIKLSENDPKKALKIIDQSIGSGWQGLFPLKEESKRESRPYDKRL